MWVCGVRVCGYVVRGVWVCGVGSMGVCDVRVRGYVMLVWEYYMWVCCVYVWV